MERGAGVIAHHSYRTMDMLCRGDPGDFVVKSVVLFLGLFSNFVFWSFGFVLVFQSLLSRRIYFSLC
jgi:hypothetical protein